MIYIGEQCGFREALAGPRREESHAATFGSMTDEHDPAFLDPVNCNGPITSPKKRGARGESFTPQGERLRRIIETERMHSVTTSNEVAQQP